MGSEWWDACYSEGNLALLKGAGISNPLFIEQVQTQVKHPHPHTAPQSDSGAVRSRAERGVGSPWPTLLSLPTAGEGLSVLMLVFVTAHKELYVFVH